MDLLSNNLEDLLYVIDMNIVSSCIIQVNSSQLV